MKKMFIICCTSFTGIMLFFALFSFVGPISDAVPVLSPVVVLQAFAMSASIALLMFVMEKILDRWDFSLWVDILVRIIICYVVVFIIGGLAGMFPLGPVALLYITPVMLPVFIVTYLVSYITCVEWAEAINKSIRRRK